MNITVGSLFMNKKGGMFTVFSINQNKVTYYPVLDSGLIIKTKAYTCKLSDIGTKYTLLNWRF